MGSIGDATTLEMGNVFKNYGSIYVDHTQQHFQSTQPVVFAGLDMLSLLNQDVKNKFSREPFPLEYQISEGLKVKYWTYFNAYGLDPLGSVVFVILEAENSVAKYYLEDTPKVRTNEN